mgnify:CR=1 FL=1
MLGIKDISVNSCFKYQYTRYGHGEPIDLFCYKYDGETNYYCVVEVNDYLQWESDDYGDENAAFTAAYERNVEASPWFIALGNIADRLFYRDEIIYFTEYHTIQKSMYRRFPRKGGLYIVSNGNCILYIGIAEKSFRQRWRQHHIYEQLEQIDSSNWNLYYDKRNRYDNDRYCKDCPTYNGLRFDFIYSQSCAFDLDHTERIVVRKLKPKINVLLK